MQTKIRINKDFYNPQTKERYKSGDRIAIEVSAKGIPLNKFWRRRYKDAKLDNCISVLSDEVAKKLEVKDEKMDFVQTKEQGMVQKTPTPRIVRKVVVSESDSKTKVRKNKKRKK